MPHSTPSLRPVAGLYEKLLTDRLEERIDELEAQGWRVVRREVGAESSPHVLARYVADRVERALEALSLDDQVVVANRILEALSTLDGAKDLLERVAEGPRQLLALTDGDDAEAYARRPATPLSEAALITNSPEDPNLGSELRQELATADRVDLLCAFVKWHGLRWLERALKAAHTRGVPIRVITTTYIGATERRALDRLVEEFGAEVKVNYETRSTRLHAKAWLFRRDSGYDTAYVGSSNLSKAALLDGLEWNVRLSSVATPAVLKKFEATFDSYWSERSFEDYDPARDARRLDEALAAAGGGGGAAPAIRLSGLEVHPYPHQRDMLERLEVERRVHDRHRNLLVAATGTGKTVMAALDYKRLRQRHGRDLRLLFVAHRKEILEQARRTYQDVLGDANFGELLIGGERPRAWEHVFAGIQALNARRPWTFAPDRFDVVVIDEFHHAMAKSYRAIIDHVRPRELLALTATPERTDGFNVQEEFFGGRIAAEMRLWEALDNDLLSPFHYFGVTDNTDMSAVAWKRGGYDIDELSNLLTGNDARARLVVRAVRDKIADPGAMRALGFCVSVQHAEFMADFFRRAGLNAKALSGRSTPEERRSVLTGLRKGTVQVVFSVDLFNEGLDIPDVDTLLLLRPTSSATVFLQQLGRGLRRTADKAVLTVLDFIGQHNKEFRFENQFRALTDLSRRRLLDGIEQDFPRLPSGCQIILEPKAKDTVLANIRSRLGVTVTRLAKEVRSHAEPRLGSYLAESGRDIADVYRSGRRSWTELLRRAGLLSGPAPEGEEPLLRRVPAFLHADDPLRVAAYTRLLEDDAPAYEELDAHDRAFARMLFFSLWPLGGGFATYQEGLGSLRAHPAVRDELRQVLAHGLEHAEHVTVPLLDGSHAVPLAVHASYSREEILPALGQSELGGSVPGHFREGVKWCESVQTDALLVTLEKDEKDFSPQTRYKDYAMNETLFHWESQNQTSESSPTGMRYRNHREMGTRVLLFVRRYKTADIGTAQPWMLLGPAEYVEHEGGNPMGIVWRLRHEIPADVWTYSAIAAG
ncbi:superfamily II DNA or RNA helicase/HKD family nuclease [Spinactinospora alkalitolerans]|uniref:Superfamily II DNA or RNA helicase/HKD family nuclease n=1 Tax=Spinactinospora alkalitolerans TaxID=687207 RepID=A0A852TUR1_9ACTN|nr:DEAD/DEAH box helicase [Spinactinospora alkalitolerans]NYE45660.1 superfamily II DNA or RNA helicase/HKD family nuclease [Spinactinospora alkalitolerans]